MRRLRSAILISIATAGVAGIARADPPPAPKPSTAPSASADPAAALPAAPPDIVLLKNGGMIRGTISELVPSDAVTLITTSGVTRRVLMTDVTYAGPADKAPKSAPKEGEGSDTDKMISPEPVTSESSVRPFVLVHGKAVSLKFVSPQPNLTLHLKTGEAEARNSWTGLRTGLTATSYTSICSAPCEASLPAGSHQLAISEGTGVPVPVPELSNLQQPSTLEGTYESRQDLRTAGWVTLIGGSVAGFALLLTSFRTNTCAASDYQCDANPIDSTKFFGGLAVALGSALVGGILTYQHDSASLAISPPPAAVATGTQPAKARRSLAEP